MKNLPDNSYLKKAVETLFLHKAEDIVVINLKKFKTILDDFLIICTCQSEVQMRAILRKCESAMKSEGLKQTKIEYSIGVKWGILKSDEFILHVFENETRNYYSLERLWAEATVIELKPDSDLATVQKTESSLSDSTEDSEHEFL